MRYPASEKLEIIRLVERSHLPVRRTLDKLGIPSPRRFTAGTIATGPSAKPVSKTATADLAGCGTVSRTTSATRSWTWPSTEPELSPRELAVTFTDTKGYFVSEASVYRLLKAHDLITSPAFVVIKAADEFHDKTTAPNQLWQTDFTYFKVIGWGWFYLSTILDDYSRYIIAWKLCTTMRADDVTETLNLALKASGCDRAKVVHKPRLLSDNGSSYISGDLAEWLEDQKIDHVRGRTLSPPDPRQDRALASNAGRTASCWRNYFLPGDLERQIGAFVDHYNNHRYHESIGNVTPADAYFGRDIAIIERRQKIKNLTIQIRRLKHQRQAA